MGRSARTFFAFLVCLAAISAHAPLAFAQNRAQSAGAERARSTSTVALEPMRTSSQVRVLRYVVAGVLIVAALGWAGRARARREDE